MNAILSITERNPSFRFDPAVLAEAIKGRWPEGDVRIVDSRPTACRWTIPMPLSKGKQIDGFLNREKTFVGVSGEVDDCAVFIIWFRSIFPDQIELALGDDQHGGTMAVNSTISAEQIKSFEDSIESPFEPPAGPKMVNPRCSEK